MRSPAGPGKTGDACKRSQAQVHVTTDPWLFPAPGDVVSVRGPPEVFDFEAIEQVRRGLLNLQRVGSEAKPYQIRQFLKLVEAQGLRMAE